MTQRNNGPLRASVSTICYTMLLKVVGHVSNTGKVISNDCTICHTVIYDSARPPEKNASIGAFQHPVDLGGLAGRKCQSCHSADKPFQHPVNLGDISMFQCVECHPK